MTRVSVEQRKRDTVALCRVVDERPQASTPTYNIGLASIVSPSHS